MLLALFVPCTLYVHDLDQQIVCALQVFVHLPVYFSFFSTFLSVSLLSQAPKHFFFLFLVLLFLNKKTLFFVLFVPEQKNFFMFLNKKKLFFVTTRAGQKYGLAHSLMTFEFYRRYQLQYSTLLYRLQTHKYLLAG